MCVRTVSENLSSGPVWDNWHTNIHLLLFIWIFVHFLSVSSSFHTEIMYLSVDPVYHGLVICTIIGSPLVIFLFFVTGRRN